MRRIVGFFFVLLLAASVGSAQELILLSAFDGAGSFDGGLVLDDNTIYTAEVGEGLSAISVLDPFSPILLDHFTEMDDVRDVVRYGNYLYASGINESIIVIDVSDPTNLQQVGLANPGSGMIMEEYQGYLYVSRYQSDNRVYSLANPLAPSQVDVFGQSVNSFFFEGNYLYMGTPDGFSIYNTSSPGNPSHVHFHDTSRYSHDMVVYGNIGFVAADDASLHLYNVANPNSPSHIDQIFMGTDPISLDLVEEYLYVGLENGDLFVYDVSSPSQPTLVDDATTPGTVADLEGQSTFLAVADGSQLLFYQFSGLSTLSVTGQIVDTDSGIPITGATVQVENLTAVTNPDGIYLMDGSLDLVPGSYTATVTSPGYDPATREIVLIDGLNWENWALGNQAARIQTLGGVMSAYQLRDLVYKDDYLFVASNAPDSPLRVYDVSEPATPTELFAAPMDHPASNVVLEGNRLYVCEEGLGFHIIGVSNPPTMFPLATVEFIGSPLEVDTDGTLAILGTQNAGMVFYDVSTPSNVQFLSTLTATSAVEDVQLDGELAVGSIPSNNQVYVIGLTTPSQPQVLSVLPVENATDLELIPPYLLVTRGENGLDVFDLSTPTSPNQVLHLATPGPAQDVTLVGNTLFLACGDDGIQGYNLDDPSAPVDLGYRGTPGIARALTVHDDIAYVVDDFDLSTYDLSRTGTAWLTLEPFNPPVMVPPVGGPFFFNLRLANNTVDAIPGQLIATATLPNGNTVEAGTVPYTLQGSGELVVEYYRQEVPGDAPAGEYLYTVQFVNSEDLLLTEDSFAFTKVGQATDAGVAAWRLTPGNQHSVSSATAGLPATFTLSAPHPNPFNLTTVLNVTVPQAGTLHVDVIDIQGRLVDTITSAPVAAGRHTLQWHNPRAASGMYVVRARLNGHSPLLRKVVLMK